MSFCVMVAGFGFFLFSCFGFFPLKGDGSARCSDLETLLMPSDGNVGML